MDQLPITWFLPDDFVFPDLIQKVLCLKISKDGQLHCTSSRAEEWRILDLLQSHRKERKKVVKFLNLIIVTVFSLIKRETDQSHSTGKIIYTTPPTTPLSPPALFIQIHDVGWTAWKKMWSVTNISRPKSWRQEAWIGTATPNIIHLCFPFLLFFSSDKPLYFLNLTAARTFYDYHWSLKHQRLSTVGWLSVTVLPETENPDMFNPTHFFMSAFSLRTASGVGLWVQNRYNGPNSTVCMLPALCSHRPLPHSLQLTAMFVYLVQNMFRQQ